MLRRSRRGGATAWRRFRPTAKREPVVVEGSCRSASSSCQVLTELPGLAGKRGSGGRPDQTARSARCGDLLFPHRLLLQQRSDAGPTPDAAGTQLRSSQVPTAAPRRLPMRGTLFLLGAIEGVLVCASKPAVRRQRHRAALECADQLFVVNGWKSGKRQGLRRGAGDKMFRACPRRSARMETAVLNLLSQQMVSLTFLSGTLTYAAQSAAMMVRHPHAASSLAAESCPLPSPDRRRPAASRGQGPGRPFGGCDRRAGNRTHIRVRYFDTSTLSLTFAQSEASERRAEQGPSASGMRPESGRPEHASNCTARAAQSCLYLCHSSASPGPSFFSTMAAEAFAVPRSWRRLLLVRRYIVFGENGCYRALHHTERAIDTLVGIKTRKSASRKQSTRQTSTQSVYLHLMQVSVTT